MPNQNAQRAAAIGVVETEVIEVGALPRLRALVVAADEVRSDSEALQINGVERLVAGEKRASLAPRLASERLAPELDRIGHARQSPAPEASGRPTSSRRSRSLPARPD